MYKSRIDRVYIKEHDIQKILNYKIVPTPFSDHDIIEIEIKWGDRPRCYKGSWAMNTQVLDDAHFEQGLMSILKLYRTNKQFLSNAEGWYHFKTNVKKLAIQTSQRQIEKNRKTFSGVSRNLMMCMHILETMNSIVYLAQS